MEPDGDGTVVTFATVQEATPALEKILAPLTRRWIQRGNDRSMQRLRDLVEGAG